VIHICKDKKQKNILRILIMSKHTKAKDCWSEAWHFKS